MPPPAAAPSRHNAEYVRALVGSTRIVETPATTVVAREAVTAAPEGTTVAAAARGSWNAHLAQLLHSVCLVSLVEKTQLGASPALVGTVGAATSASSAARRLPSVHSVAVEPRWLDAVTRYCHFTFTLDDIARVAMVFPDHVRVRWTLDASASSHEADAADADADNAGSASAVLCTPSPAQKSQQHCPQRSTAGGILRARLYLPADHVVSAAEAELHLEQALHRKGSPAAQRAWKELVNQHSAYAAYLEAGDRAPGAKGAAATTLAGESPSADGQHEPLQRRTGGGGAAAAEPSSASDSDLLSQLSAELKASLSPAMLRSLLTQMRRDAAQTERRALQHAAAVQLQERLLSAYEHVRALLGGKQASGRSASAVLAAMRDESRFDDALDSVSLLSSLLEIPASGLTATLLDEAHVLPSPHPPQQQPQQPAPSTSSVAAETGRRKRQRSAAVQEAAPALPAVVAPLTEPMLKPVTNLRPLSEAQLQLVRVQLDRSKGSVKGVIDAIYCTSRGCSR